MARKILILGVVLMMCLGVFTACRGNLYNAAIYNDTSQFFRKDFLKSNLTFGCYYKDDDGQNVHVTDEGIPRYYSYVVKTEERVTEIFSEPPFVTNFDEQMLIIHIFTSPYSRPYKIAKVIFNDGELCIDIKLKSANGLKDATAPGQRVLIIKMDKLDFDTLVVNEI